MKAARVHRFGPTNVIAIEDIAIPQPGSGEVLVRVAAAGVGPWDAWIRAGKSALPQPLPLTLGSDFSGVVEVVGEAVRGFQPGDRVFGVKNARFVGAHAEFAVVVAAMIASKPVRLGDIEMASVPVVAVTAWQALFEQAKLTAGQTVLIHGAAGNVGAYAVQLARRARLRVIGTAGARDLAFVRTLGTDQVIDFASARFEDIVSGLDAVIDLVGGAVQQRSFSVLRPGGTLVSVVSPPDQNAAARHGIRALFFLVDVTTARLEQIAAMVEANELTTNVGTVLPLAEAQSAHEMQASQPGISGERRKPRIAQQPRLRGNWNAPAARPTGRGMARLCDR
jgi:NADPH:quinone reductase-like Zn-dependent oxidoreductase